MAKKEGIYSKESTKLYSFFLELYPAFHYNIFLQKRIFIAIGARNLVGYLNIEETSAKFFNFNKY
ncbi:hypothetical protein DRF62_10100 [Chryseobacterium piscium]|uniref:Uncharacterized protein n=1 Tax=Chryseobacterium piscium TaxID=333702 RepID=A0A3D9BLE6_9FLAO|nr:hypothetical protein DRF62_10100 [Chryseobacterium piscium]